MPWAALGGPDRVRPSVRPAGPSAPPARSDRRTRLGPGRPSNLRVRETRVGSAIVWRPDVDYVRPPDRARDGETVAIREVVFSRGPHQKPVWWRSETFPEQVIQASTSAGTRRRQRVEADRARRSRVPSGRTFGREGLPCHQDGLVGDSRAAGFPRRVGAGAPRQDAPLPPRPQSGKPSRRHQPPSRPVPRSRSTSSPSG